MIPPPRYLTTTERRTCLLCGGSIRLMQLGSALAVIEGHEPDPIEDRPHVCQNPLRLRKRLVRPVRADS